MTEKQQQLFDALSNALSASGTDTFVYSSSIPDLWPAYAIYVNGESINHLYQLPPLGHADFDALGQLGYIEKIHETEEDPVTFEIERTYRWKLPIK